MMKPKPDRWKILKTYDSKKNEVKKIEFNGRTYIVKKFHEKFIHGLKVEERVLRGCAERDIPVPGIVDVEKNMLILEYIPGEDCKLLFDTKKDERKKMISSIAAWLGDFHQAFDQKRRGDCILSNFILKDHHIYGIDFEESEQGDPLRDIGDMCTSILRMEPSFTEEKFVLVQHLIDEYFSNISKGTEDLTDSVVESMLHYSRYGSQKMLMESWAKKIKEVGLDNITQNRV